MRFFKHLGQFSSQKARELNAFDSVERSNYMLRFFFSPKCVVFVNPLSYKWCNLINCGINSTDRMSSTAE